MFWFLFTLFFVGLPLAVVVTLYLADRLDEVGRELPHSFDPPF